MNISELTTEQRMQIVCDEITHRIAKVPQIKKDESAADLYYTAVRAASGVQGIGNSIEEVMSTSEIDGVNLAYGVAVLGAVLSEEAEKLFHKANIIDEILKEQSS